MYSPTTRLLTLLELLQSHRQMSCAEIARRLEVDVRTVRRYIVMLQDMGIPIEGERGPYGTYHLERGYKLPPLMFTDAEAVALTLALLTIRVLQFPVEVAAIEGALAKTERVMPEMLLQQARALRESITFNLESAPVQPQSDVVQRLSSAIHTKQQVRLNYRAWSGDESERLFDPYGIVLHEGYWYTAGYCHLRHDLRTFRLDRIVSLEDGDHTFEPPANFDSRAHVIQSLASAPGTFPVTLLLETTMENARQELPAHTGTFEQTDGGVLFRPGAAHVEWISHALLYLDFPVHIIESDEVRDQLRHLAAKALQMAGDATL